MRNYPLVVAFAAALAVVTPQYAPAQVESTPIPAPKKPNFASLDFLVGSWSCSTKSARRPAPYLSTVTYALDSTGWWLEETTTTTPTKWFPTQSKLVSYDKITYESDTHRWVDVSYNNLGGSDLSVSPGWNGDKFVWHSLTFAATPDISSQTDNTTTKVSNTKTTFSSSFTEAKTGRVVAVTGVCTKR